MMRVRALVLIGLALPPALAGCSAEKVNPDGPVQVRSMLTECPEQPADQAQGAELLPPLSFDCPGGGSLDLGRAPGVPTVINLWGSWCSPCREELPVIQAFANDTHDEVRVVGVISKDGLPQAESFAADAGVVFPNAFDGEGQLMSELGLNALPYTYFLDADGGLVHTEVGPVDSVDELRGLVTEHLGVQL